MAVNKVIARFADGRVAKGSTHNFDVANAWFHLLPENGSGAGGAKTIEIVMRDLKAVFFVNDFAGKPDYEEKKDFNSGPGTLGRRIKITFKDGELMVGSTLNYDPSSNGFFVIPADPHSNNKRAFIVNSAIKDVELI